MSVCLGELSEALNATLKPETFWSALGAVGTLIASIIALCLPFLLERNRRLRISRMLARELHTNFEDLKRDKKDLEGILREKGAESVYSRAEMLQLVANGCSKHLWNTFGAELSAKRYPCFSRLYQQIDKIIEPEKAVALANSSDEVALSKAHTKFIEEFIENYEKDSKKCRYLRQF